jgi:transcription initiation factor TFIIH subunit 3
MDASSSASSSSTSTSSNSLLVIVVDVSPSAWGDREWKRTAQDQQRTAQGKRSVGPAILHEVLESIVAFAVAASSMERSAGIIIMGVADQTSAILFPRNGPLTTWLQSAPGTYTPSVRNIQHNLITGVAELVQRVTVVAATTSTTTTSLPNHLHHHHHHVENDDDSYQAAMAAAFSKALCLINRFLVASQAGLGVSALSTAHYMERAEDEGVIALMNNHQKNSKHQRTAGSTSSRRSAAWSPRILLVQASADRSRDYNAFMNCAFSAAKHHITVDGCYLSTELSSSASSAFLEQACDLTGGVFLAPSGAAQVGGALTAVLFAVFLPPISCRHQLNLPALHQVDFRARCFETNETVDMAYVCNQCLSIFKNRPQTAECSTCQATIVGNEKFSVGHDDKIEQR